MKITKWLITALAALGSMHSFGLDFEHALWDKTPIHISLSLSEERLIHFSQAISIVDNEAGDKIAILKIQDALYIQAKEEFSNKRLLVQLMPQGEVIILSLSADKTINSNKPIEILTEKEAEAKPINDDSKPNLDINAVTLTRFAIQSIYAPERLLVIPGGVARTPMQTHRQITLFYGASIEARPLISWHGGEFYVTAIELKNQLNKEVVIDPRHMIGNWQTATFYPTNTLAGRGTKTDTTTVFLISDRPFNEAMTNPREFVR